MTILLLNGVGSAGKTTLGKALQAMTREVFLHVQMDAFLDMLPDPCPGGFTFETIERDGHPEVVIASGPAGTRAMHGMRRAVAALADAGNNLIVDDVNTGAEWHEYDALLAHHIVHRIGILCPLAILEAREAARGDRLIGLARWQFPRVHAGRDYDFTVDTGASSVEACARLIRGRFDL